MLGNGRQPAHRVLLAYGEHLCISTQGLSSRRRSSPWPHLPLLPCSAFPLTLRAAALLLPAQSLVRVLAISWSPAGTTRLAVCASKTPGNSLANSRNHWRA